MDTPYSEYVELPITPYGNLLLVPKVIVRHRMDYDAEEYYRMYLLPQLQAEELAAGTELVHLLRDGTPRVTKKDVQAKYGRGKRVIVRETLRRPEILEKYRSDKRHHIRQPLTHADLTGDIGTPDPDWDALLDGVQSTRPGPAEATAFHGAVESLLSPLFYPSLAMPRMEYPIHQGRKRIDITYTNVGGTGFFGWVANHYPAPHVFVECKNYSRDLSNPELDQLQGRFSPSRGKVGLLVFRRIDDKDLFIQRCRDTARDNRGFIIPLDDHDLEQLVNERKSKADGFGLLKERFDALVM